jgi:hypothetical protein
MKAFLIAHDGQVKPLGDAGRSGGTNALIKCFLLAPPMTDHGPFDLEFRLPSNERPVARWRIEYFNCITSSQQIKISCSDCSFWADPVARA